MSFIQLLFTQRCCQWCTHAAFSNKYLACHAYTKPCNRTPRITHTAKNSVSFL